MLTERDIGWFQGIVDGEGCLTIHVDRRISKTLGTRLNYHPELVVCNTKYEVVKRCKEITGIGNIYSRDRPQPSKKIYQWSVSAKQLKGILPILKGCVKTPEINIIEEVMEITSTRRPKPMGGQGTFRTDAELLRLEELRQSLIDLHGLNARKMSKPVNFTLSGVSTPLIDKRHQVMPSIKHGGVVSMNVLLKEMNV